MEVFHAGRWGTVCGEDFDKVAASVVCRKLGFGTAQTVVENASAFGQGTVSWILHVETSRRHDYKGF